MNSTLQPATSTSERLGVVTFLMVYVFPLQLLVGLVGNVFNLIVLLSKEMRTKTNILLAMMALADMLFLIFMLPHSLMFNSYFTKQPAFRKFILYSNHHITGLANTTGFTSAWIIVVVSVERVMAVMWPLKARHFWTSRTLISIIIFIWVCAFAVSFHSHITHEITLVTFNRTVVDSNGHLNTVLKSSLAPRLRPNMEKFWKVAILLDVVLLVIVPVILVITANVLLVWSLRRHQMVHVKSQRRATIIVFMIASTFTICQIPSAVIYIWELVWPQDGATNLFRTMATLTNSCVVTGKTANFFLFCTWSAHFRQNLCKILAGKMPYCYHLLEKVIPQLKNAGNDSKAVMTTTIPRSRFNTVRQYSQPVDPSRLNHSRCSSNSSSELRAQISLPLTCYSQTQERKTSADTVSGLDNTTNLDNGDQSTRPLIAQTSHVIQI